MAEVTYYFNIRGVGWTTDPDNMLDGDIATYSSTADNGDINNLVDNTCSGTDLGTITKVEIRAYAHGDGNDRIDLISYFGFLEGAEHQTTPATEAGWGGYVDITLDTNAPSPWTWAGVVLVNCWVTYTKSGKGNTMYCSKVEIRVTYTPPGAAAAHSFGNTIG